MKFKRFLSLVCAGCMTLSLIGVANAADISNSADEVAESVTSLAYMDLDTAPAEMRDAILDARYDIVYGHQAWTVNGAVSILHKDGTVEALPEFSDLFPGWDLKEISGRGVQPITQPSFSLTPASTSSIGTSRTITLAMPVSGRNTEPFYKFNGDGSTVVTWAQTISAPESQKYFNVGYTDEDNIDQATGLGTDLGWIPDIPVGEKIATLETEDGVRYGVRASASAFGVAGSAYVHVEVLEDE